MNKIILIGGSPTAGKSFTARKIAESLKLSCILNEDEPWDSYDQVVTQLIGEQNHQSQLGGYPKWIQGEATPLNKDKKSMKLLFQICSEDNAELMWEDDGAIYVFYDKETEKLEFILQCY